jgi:hypothetical protein
MTPRKLAERQFELFNEVVNKCGIVITECGHCASILLRKIDEEGTMTCHDCGATMGIADCPDIWNDISDIDSYDDNHLKGVGIGSKVIVAEYYINDEASGGSATPTAIVRGEINNDNLVCIEYENGVIDHVPQDIIRPYKESEISYEDVQQIATNIGIALFHNQVIEVIERYEDEKDDDPTSNWGEVVENIIYSMFN